MIGDSPSGNAFAAGSAAVTVEHRSVPAAGPRSRSALLLPVHSARTGAHASCGASQSLTVTVPPHDASSAPSLTRNVTCVAPSAYGPAGVCVSVSTSASGSEEPLSIDAAAVQLPTGA